MISSIKIVMTRLLIAFIIFSLSGIHAADFEQSSDIEIDQTTSPCMSLEFQEKSDCSSSEEKDCHSSDCHCQHGHCHSALYTQVNDKSLLNDPINNQYQYDHEILLHLNLLRAYWTDKSL